jgi:hypothetical protein
MAHFQVPLSDFYIQVWLYITMFSLSVDDTAWCLDYPDISDDIEEIKKITEKTLLNEWTGEASPQTSHSEVVLHPGMWGHQKFCGKWCKILHSSNFLAPNYNSKKNLFLYSIFTLQM